MFGGSNLKFLFTETGRTEQGKCCGRGEICCLGLDHLGFICLLDFQMESEHADGKTRQDFRKQTCAGNTDMPFIFIGKSLTSTCSYIPGKFNVY